MKLNTYKRLRQTFLAEKGESASKYFERIAEYFKRLAEHSERMNKIKTEQNGNNNNNNNN